MSALEGVLIYIINLLDKTKLCCNYLKLKLHSDSLNVVVFLNKSLEVESFCNG